MELPGNIKSLYRHWAYHAETPSEVVHANDFPHPEILTDIEWLIHERMRIWKQKISCAPRPWTQDPILDTYKFCNIFREFDRQTIEFHALLKPLCDDFPLWLLNIFYCRMVARPETILHTGLLSYEKSENNDLYKKLMASPRPRFGTPYVFPISTIQKSATPTRELFIAKHLPQVMTLVAKEVASWSKKSVYDGAQTVLPLFGYNLSFLWTEVLIDVAYQYPELIDLFARFPIGPGSAPTMSRIDSVTDPSLLVQKLSLLNIDTGLTYEGKPIRLSAENWEGIGCEYRKYTNLKAGHGRKRLYNNG